MIWKGSTSQDLRDQIVGISSDKLCLRMAKPLRETPVPHTSPACSYPTMTSMIPFRQINQSAVLDCAISV